MPLFACSSKFKVALLSHTGKLICSQDKQKRTNHTKKNTQNTDGQQTPGRSEQSDLQQFIQHQGQSAEVK